MCVNFRVKGKICALSNSQQLKYGAVKLSRNFCDAVSKIDGQDSVAAVTTASQRASPPCHLIDSMVVMLMGDCVPDTPAFP